MKADFVKCVELGGRSSRSEFWWLHLFFVTVFLLASLVDVLVGTFLNILFFFAFMWPSIAVSVRRLHDIGRSGWWYLICMVPIIGEVFLIVYWASPGDKGSNRYGPNPNQRTQNPQQTPDTETQAVRHPTPEHQIPPGVDRYPSDNEYGFWVGLAIAGLFVLVSVVGVAVAIAVG